MKTNVSQIISGKPPRGVNKYMLEEVYFSDLCKASNEPQLALNPQNARFVDGRYYFDYPALWYHTLDNNKAIALRKIDLRGETLNISLKITINREVVGSGAGGSREITVSLPVQPNSSTLSILRDICRQVNIAISSNGRKKWSTSSESTIELVPTYNYETSTATITFVRTYDNSGGETYHFSFKISDLNEDAQSLFKKKNAELPAYTAATKTADGTNKYDFPGVWNREFLFVHASFVNGTSFNYLGRSGEFYTKPSKMYKFGGSSQQFYFELSFDGIHPVKEKIGVFCIDLAYIYHDRDYQAE